MYLARRIVSWSLFLACITALGACVFQFVRHRPRCTIDGPLTKIHLSPDGSRLVTLRTQPNSDKYIPKEPGAGLMYGPLQIWDTDSGRVIHESLDEVTMRKTKVSPDGQHIAIITGERRIGAGKLWLANCHPGHERQIADVTDVNRMEFSPKGRWLVVYTASGESLIIEVGTHKLAMRINGNWPSFSRDDKLLYFCNGPKHDFTVWDMESGKVLGALGNISGQYAISEDGRLLVEQHQEEVPTRIDDLPRVGRNKNEERKDYRVDVWDLATFTHRSHHELPRAGNVIADLSPDGNHLALWLRRDDKSSNLEMIHTATGQRLWTFAMKDGCNCYFSPDGSLCAFFHGLPKETLTMLDTATGRVLWERLADGTTRFAENTDIVLTQKDFTEQQQFIDARTGVLKATAPLNFPTANHIPILTPDGRHFSIGGWHKRSREAHFWETWLEKHWPEMFGEGLEGVMVMESATGRELLRIVKCDSLSRDLSDDSSTLITIEPRGEPGTIFAICAWDVHPNKAWSWASGAACAAGLLGRFVIMPLTRFARRHLPGKRGTGHKSDKV